jgi:hypothetical protein
LGVQGRCRNTKRSQFIKLRRHQLKTSVLTSMSPSSPSAYRIEKSMVLSIVGFICSYYGRPSPHTIKRRGYRNAFVPVPMSSHPKSFPSSKHRQKCRLSLPPVNSVIVAHHRLIAADSNHRSFHAVCMAC